MNSVVFITKKAQKDLKNAPRHIQVQFEYWIRTIELEGYLRMQAINGYNDHPLKGIRKGQRSSYLSRSWRVIYSMDDKTNQIVVEVLEVNKHDY